MTTAIVNYGLGNLRSVSNAVEALGHEVVIADRPALLASSDRVILPGVGAFGDGMRKLEAGGWVEALEANVLRSGKYFLGICLGMQLLAEYGTEHGENRGLGWVRGTVDRLHAPTGLRLPHIGWNDVLAVRDGKLLGVAGVTASYYFVHSYALQPAHESIVTGVCTYGTAFVATIEKDNVFATQFHPEKSQKAGLLHLRRFLELRG